MKVLIVDDEPLARERLRRFCEEDLTGYSVVAEASDGASAVTQAQQHAPDVVLLDVRMPGMDGLEAARHLAELDPAPAVIFTTAYDDYALEAFAVHAVGYLLKPVRREKLEEALKAAAKPNRVQLAALRGDDGKTRARSHISARVRGNLMLIKIDDVLYFQADQKYITVRHPAGEVLIEEALKDLEEEFGERFVRIHRNALVALAGIVALERDALGRTVVRMKGIHETLEVSRRHLPGLRATLKQL
ncbi:response regulator transcription factor [Permianibacter sp. IMCC34836]|uniref:LytR/AlgR family response regulator transcription factor n=1 Tax=Permianibacter fluminis TaxID=2738515 RepID=UPI001552172E|nr:LytTR family DNA-binding domain-containing protein [Permianibacter fluminis]NQD36118.1 response regulator transcription factor [Permianibacter fluminis]